ncbi:hypothetical protein Indivirus_11_6 [Indivirus ILV1]|uniref:Uncharacterized protein n=1 Tax=Indivirus ILV1 TaxID=1977633 RepID=A0A1V0SEC4_9VIRU|nr:hypothetical protein Indivirus_11_6 [Indivirus ILV1]
MCQKKNCTKCKSDSDMVFIATNPGIGTTGPTTPVCPPNPPLPSDNEVIMFKQNKHGFLDDIHHEKTGGLGTGPGLTFCEDPLCSQGSLTVSTSKKLVFVVNAGDANAGATGPANGTVSSMKVSHDKLKKVDVVDSGGVFPCSVATYGDLLYVLNGGANTNVVAFKIKSDGKLENLGVKGTFNYVPMDNGQPALFIGALIGPAQVKFTLDGKKLIVDVKDNTLSLDSPRGSFYVFDVQSNGDLTNMVKNDSSGYTPWGFDIYKNYLISTELFGQDLNGIDPFGQGALSSYRINSNNTLTPISVSIPSGQSTPCWIARYEKYFYLCNSRFLPGSVSIYKINSQGELVMWQAVGYETTNHVVEVASLDNQLYLLCPGSTEYTSGLVDGALHVLDIDRHSGYLTLKQIINVTKPLSGLQGIATLKF